MEITYELIPTDMIITPVLAGQQNVVVYVHWKYKAKSGPYTAMINPTGTELTYNPENQFTQYMDLTKDQVAEWVINSWTLEQKTQYQQQLVKMITDQQLKSHVNVSLPWNN